MRVASINTVSGNYGVEVPTWRGSMFSRSRALGCAGEKAKMRKMDSEPNWSMFLPNLKDRLGH